MEIKACPNCGSRRIYQGRMGDGVLTGYTTRDVCRNCGFQGTSIIFDSEEDYKKFLKSKSKVKIQKKEINKKEKPALKNKRPTGIIILSFIMVFEAFFSIYIYYSLFGFNIVSWLWIYYIIIFLISAVILPINLLRGKPWAWTIGSALFALSIPIGLIFLYYLTRPHVKAYFGKN
jgi:hypothetical protein